MATILTANAASRQVDSSPALLLEPPYTLDPEVSNQEAHTGVSTDDSAADEDNFELHAVGTKPVVTNRPVQTFVQSFTPS